MVPTCQWATPVPKETGEWGTEAKEEWERREGRSERWNGDVTEKVKEGVEGRWKGENKKWVESWRN